MKIKKIIRSMLSDDLILQFKSVISAINNRKMRDKCQQLQPFQKTYDEKGINLIGDIQAETGLGQSVRILAAVMNKGQIPFCVQQVALHGELAHNNDRWNDKLVETPVYGVNVIHIIPETWAADYLLFDQALLNHHYNIAYWLWELEEFPDRWLPCLETVNEIWTPSEFISRSIRKKTDKPVVTVPYFIEMQAKEGMSRAYFGLSEDKFLFLMMYDFISISERKNPRAAIHAFKKAFPIENAEVGLIVKVNHADENKLFDLRNELKEYQNIYFITGNLTREEVDSLLRISDVLISLHRAEGFGLPIAEAMALGKPVIATNWSATVEFMDAESACPVDFKLVPLEKSIGPYEKGNYWADADINHAAHYIKKLWENKEYREKIGKNAEKRIKECLTCEHAADIMRERLKAIYETDSIC